MCLCTGGSSRSVWGGQLVRPQQPNLPPNFVFLLGFRPLYFDNRQKKNNKNIFFLFFFWKKKHDILTPTFRLNVYSLQQWRSHSHLEEALIHKRRRWCSFLHPDSVPIWLVSCSPYPNSFIHTLYRLGFARISTHLTLILNAPQWSTHDATPSNNCTDQGMHK